MKNVNTGYRTPLTGIYKCKIALSIYLLYLSAAARTPGRGIMWRCPLNNTDRNVTVPAEISWVWILHPVILSAYTRLPHRPSRI